MTASVQQEEALMTLLMGRWEQASRKIAELAETIPPNEFDSRPLAGIRSFSEVLRHVAFWNQYVAETLNGKKADDAGNELPLAMYSTKESTLEAFRRSSADVASALCEHRGSLDLKATELIMAFVEHTSEHYGQLVVYTRLMASRRRRLEPNRNWRTHEHGFHTERDFHECEYRCSLGGASRYRRPAHTIGSRFRRRHAAGAGRAKCNLRQCMVVRELIVDVNDESKRVVWSAQSELMTHHNGSAQVFKGEDGRTRVVWIADLLPDEAASPVGQMMEQGMVVMKKTLDALAEKGG